MMDTVNKVLSVIVPVYNEKETVSVLLDKLVNKKIPGIDLEIIIIESNSSDGSRSLVLRYEQLSFVKLILESKPCGKGAAVRKGLEVATGEYILIQDADLEYDIDDYDKLLKPLVDGKAKFVLGARAKDRGVFGMRQIDQKPLVSFFINSGHFFFSGLINWLFWQKIYDPFTMYKVFSRDCLEGIKFKCRYFDFDGELLLKLLKKGYKPLEISVSYQARSFADGKKIRVFRDSWLLLRVIILCRLGLC